MNAQANPNVVSGPQHCRECDSVHERCVCDWCHVGPPPMEPYCGSCDHHHPAGDSHCPNCRQPASSGFHATWQLDKCPVWVGSRGWVAIPDLTGADKAELARQWPEGPWAELSA